MIKTFKVEMNKPIKQIHKTTMKQMKVMNKTVQNLKMKIEAIKNTHPQSEAIPEMKTQERGQEL